MAAAFPLPATLLVLLAASWFLLLFRVCAVRVCALPMLPPPPPASTLPAAATRATLPPGLAVALVMVVAVTWRWWQRLPCGGRTWLRWCILADARQHLCRDRGLCRGLGVGVSVPWRSRVGHTVQDVKHGPQEVISVGTGCRATRRGGVSAAGRAAAEQQRQQALAQLPLPPLQPQSPRLLLLNAAQLGLLQSPPLLLPLAPPAFLAAFAPLQLRGLCAA